MPHNIYELLTPVALAHLIMGDGSAWAYALLICTDSFSIPDAVRLMNVLIVRYELNCSLRFHRPNQPRIHIKQKSMPKLSFGPDPDKGPVRNVLRSSNSNTFYVWINDV